jgi:hypothetical protein
MIIKVRLADPAQALPWPGVPGRVIAGEEIVEIDDANPFFAACIRDGSLIGATMPDLPAKSAAKER